MVPDRAGVGIRADYGEEPPPEAEGARAARLCRTCSPSSWPGALLTAQIAAAQAPPAPTPAPDGAHQKACLHQPPLWEVMPAPGRQGPGRPQLPARWLEGNQRKGRAKVEGWGGVGTPGFYPQGWPVVVSRVMVPQRLPHPNPQKL